MKVSKKIIWIHRQLKYHQLRIKNEISISLEIILNVLNVWQYHFPLSSVTVNIVWEFAMLPDLYILLSPQKEEVHSSSWGNRCTHLATHLSKRLKPLFVIILVCLGNTLKKQDCNNNCFAIGPPSVDFW